MTAPSRVWQSWTAGNPEPRNVFTVRDASDVVSYDDSPEWQRQLVNIQLRGTDSIWRGYKGGGRCELSWPELLVEFGPVTGVIEEKPRPKVETPAEPPVAPWPHFGGVTA